MQFKQCILSPFYKWSKNKLESLQSFRIVTLYHISLVLGHWDDQYRNPNDIQRSSRWAGQPHSICRTVEVGTKSLRKADQRQFWLLSPTVLLLSSVRNNYPVVVCCWHWLLTGHYWLFYWQWLVFWWLFLFNGGCWRLDVMMLVGYVTV